MTTTTIIEPLLKIALSGVMGVVCALFTYFIDYTFWRGSIFGFYLPWLAKTLLRFFNKKELKKVLDLKDTMPAEDFEELLKDTAADHVFLYKMLGGCAVCFGMWVAMLSYAAICLTSALEWYYCFTYIFVSSWAIRKLVKATY